jgi:hypothetical protein
MVLWCYMKDDQVVRVESSTSYKVGETVEVMN